MVARRRLAGRLTSTARSELNRRLGSAKQPVLILSADPNIHSELTELMDSGYLISHADTLQDALQQLKTCDEMTLVFVDYRLEGRPAMYQFVRDLPEMRRRNVIPILLMGHESDAITEELSYGVQDVLIKPYNTPLHKFRIRMMSHMGMANRKLGQLPEQQMAKSAAAHGLELEN